ncbi:uncharacterized protein LOC134018441 isoform X2 [Osmerus eperlanus]
MAVNCQLKPGAKHNRYELLAWLNASLHTRFTKVEQTCSGAAFCQMMDWLFPDSVDLSQVKFLPRHEEDSLQNYSVLQAAFRKTGVVQSVPVKELVQGSLDTALDFLIWFKAFFDANHSARDYNALEARGGQSMVPRTPTSTPADSPTPRTRAKTQLTLNMNEAAEHPWQRSKDTPALSRPPIKRQIKVERGEEAKVENDEAEMDERINMELKVVREITEENGDLDEDEKMDEKKVEQTESGFKMDTGERTGGEMETEGKGTGKEGATVEGGRKEQNLEIQVTTNMEEKESKRGEKTEKKEDEKTEGKEGKRTEKEEDKRTEGKMTEKEDGRTEEEEATREEDEMEEDGTTEGEEDERTEMEEDGMTEGEEEETKEKEKEKRKDKRTDKVEAEREEERPLSRRSLIMQRFLKHWSEKNQELRQGLGQDQAQQEGQVQGEGLAGGLSSSTVRQVRGLRYLQDIVYTLLHTPYTLYFYRHVDVGAGQTACLLLIGYYHQKSGGRVLRLLEALQPKEDTSTALLTCLRRTLTRLGLPLANLAWFYCDVAGREEQASLEAGVRGMSPRMVSLCGLPGLAGSVCQAGVAAVSEEVVELVRDVHRHRSAFTPTHDSLTQLFAAVPEFDPNLPVATQCLFFTRMVQAIAQGWVDLLGYFSSLGGGGDAQQIHARLTDSRLRLLLLFLTHALEPLAAFEEAMQGGSMDLEGILQVAGTLLRTYCTRFLRPCNTNFFLWRRNPEVLQNKNHYLNRSEVDIGGARVKDSLSESAVQLEDVDAFRGQLVDTAIAFYREVTRGLSDSLPLSEAALKRVTVLLRPAWKRDVMWTAVKEVASQLGVCKDGMGGDTDRLLGEYQEYLKRPPATSPPGKVEDAEQHWGQVLEGLERGSVFRRLMLSLLALPGSLQRDTVLTQAFENRCQVPAEWRKADGEQKTTPFSLPGPRIVIESDSDSSDVIVTEVTWKPVKLNSSNAKPPKMSKSIVVDEEDDIIWMPILNNQSEEQHTPPSVTSTPEPPARKSGFYQDDGGYDVGELVWGHMEGCSMWPGVVRAWESRPVPSGVRRVEWYLDGMFSEIGTQGLHRFAAFSQHFCANSFATLITYREAIFKSLQVAAERCMKVFCPDSDKREEELRVMLDWAFGGFKPSGPSGFAPPPFTPDETEGSSTNAGSKLPRCTSTSNKDSYGSSLSLPTKLRQVSVSLKKLSLCLLKGGSVRLSKHRRPQIRPRKRPKTGVRLTPPEEDTSPDWQPPHKRTSSYYKAKESRHVYVQPDPKHREAMVREILEAGAAIEEFCLCCGTNDYETQHPLFEGGLCARCKDNFTETLHRYDEDGYQSYCTICCSGLEVLLCGNDSCSRSYCVDCVNILVGSKTFEFLKEVDPWICYLCQPSQRHGALQPRHDWSVRVQTFFFNNSAMEFEPHRVYPSLPASQRRPIRVLSLFDGIATGYLVLKELGFKVEIYMASEVCEESIAVSTVNHEGIITQVDDVRSITKEHLKKWGPFDLLIGGSPCNDLSIVNPIRKGLFEGTGRLFFEYYRILDLLKPKENNPRPFFWLFENVVFMNNHDRLNICRFLECNPVVVDAVKVSPAHRARCFWGNIPGMSRPIIASKNDKLLLQDCLEIGRTAKFTKVRTITTNPASMKQGKDMSKLPVLDENKKEDTLWITELEQIFGFPKHYTDVKNMNRQQRQKVLGKSWSVPVIRHLFAPLKDYFACEQLPP